MQWIESNYSNTNQLWDMRFNLKPREKNNNSKGVLWVYDFHSKIHLLLPKVSEEFMSRKSAHEIFSIFSTAQRRGQHGNNVIAPSERQ